MGRHTHTSLHPFKLLCVTFLPFVNRILHQMFSGNSFDFFHVLDVGYFWVFTVIWQHFMAVLHIQYFLCCRTLYLGLCWFTCLGFLCHIAVVFGMILKYSYSCYCIKGFFNCSACRKLGFFLAFSSFLSLFCLQFHMLCNFPYKCLEA